MKGKRKRNRPFELAPGDAGLMLTCFKAREYTAAVELEKMILAELEEEQSTMPSYNNGDLIEDSFRAELCAYQTGKKGELEIPGMGDVKCIVFAKCHQLNSVELAIRIWERALMTGVKYSRHGQRLIPIEMSCKANFEALMTMWPKFVQSRPDLFYQLSHGRTPPLNTTNAITYAVSVEKRLNDTITKTAFIELLAGLMADQKGPNGEIFIVDLKWPRMTIMVQVVKNFLGISAIYDFVRRFKSGNIQLLADTYRAVTADGQFHGQDSC